MYRQRSRVRTFVLAATAALLMYGLTTRSSQADDHRHAASSTVVGTGTASTTTTDAGTAAPTPTSGCSGRPTGSNEAVNQRPGTVGEF